MPETLGQWLQSGVWASVVLAAACVLAVSALRTVRALAASPHAPVSPEGHEALAGSRFTIPVSLVVHVGDAGSGLVASVRSLLDLQYPQLEVIVVTDGRTSGAVEALKAAFDLSPKEIFYRCSLPSGHVEAIYGSAGDSRLLVVDHASSDAASAWNCGANLARYRYVAIVPSGRFCRPDALLSVMAPVNADPASVAAIVGDLGAQDRRSVDREVAGERRAAASRGAALMAGFDELKRLRAQSSDRVAAVDLGATLDSPEGFGVWRRDALVEAGGFAAGCAGAGLDLAIRLKETAVGGDAPELKVLLMPAASGRRTGTLADAMHRHALRCQALLEAAWRMRRESRSGQTQVLAHRLASLLPDLCEAWLIVALPAGVVAGAIDWRSAVLCALVVSFAKGAASNAALLRVAAQPASTIRRPARTICLGGLEFALYGPLAAIAALTGFWRFLGAWRRTPVNAAAPES